MPGFVHHTIHRNSRMPTTNQIDNTTKIPFVKSVIPIACGAAHTAWQIAISEVQRQSIYADPMWQIGRHGHATMGLAVARQMGMITYRTAKGYHNKFGRTMSTNNEKVPYGSKAQWQTKSYLEYQGRKFLSRFDPITYVKMTEQMDSHDISRGRGESLEEVLAKITIPALVMGIDSDVLYPLAEQEFLATHMSNATFKVIHSEDGHDGFLLEQDQVATHISNFLSQLGE
jgi:homoserine O-acetyltransferase/O-succinyltransferase